VLAEVATLFDLQPQKKQQLLLDAQALAQDEQLKARIADDLRRIELLRQPIAFSAPALDGTTLDLAALSRAVGDSLLLRQMVGAVD
jgi:hypothetical protein